MVTYYNDQGKSDVSQFSTQVKLAISYRSIGLF